MFCAVTQDHTFGLSFCYHHFQNFNNLGTGHSTFLFHTGLHKLCADYGAIKAKTKQEFLTWVKMRMWIKIRCGLKKMSFGFDGSHYYLRKISLSKDFEGKATL